jgi:hypothetical protein
MVSESTNNIMSKLLLIVITLISTVCMVIGQSKYSGIYSGRAGNDLYFLGAVTLGGRIMTDYSFEYYGYEAGIDPYKSFVSKTGKFKAISRDGSISATGTATSKFTFSGTAKSGGLTYRISGKRILK